MGGAASYNPYQYAQAPSMELPLQALRNQQATSTNFLDAFEKLGLGALKNQGQLLNYGASEIPKIYTPDIPGLQQMAVNEATINAANKRALEKVMSPDAAALRENLPKALSEELQMFGGAGSTGPSATGVYNDITKQNLARLFGTGFSPDSTVGRSGLFDANTMQGLQLKRQAMQDASSYLQQNPQQQAGIDPGQLIAMQEAAKQQGIAQQNAFKQNVFAGAQGLGQSAWNLNQGMLGATAQTQQAYNQGLNSLINKNSQDWQNYSNLGMQAAAQGAAGQNALTGSEYGAAGSALGMAAMALI